MIAAKYSTLIAPATQSSHECGAIPHEHGVTFRLKAPQADRVYLLGQFNLWDEARTPLQDMGEGIWQVVVEDAEMGDEYLFVCYQNGERTELVDPNADRLTSDRKFAIIKER